MFLLCLFVFSKISLKSAIVITQSLSVSKISHVSLDIIRQILMKHLK